MKSSHNRKVPKLTNTNPTEVCFAKVKGNFLNFLYMVILKYILLEHPSRENVSWNFKGSDSQSYQFLHLSTANNMVIKDSQTSYIDGES